MYRDKAGQGLVKTSVQKPTGGRGRGEHEYMALMRKWEELGDQERGRERVGFREKAAYT